MLPLLTRSIALMWCLGFLACGGSPTTPSVPWSRTGAGNLVFDMPSRVSRVQITGTFNGACQNFVVRVSQNLVVNEILGTCTIGIGSRYSGVHQVSGGTTEVTNSTGVLWTFEEIR